MLVKHRLNNDALLYSLGTLSQIKWHLALLLPRLAFSERYLAWLAIALEMILHLTGSFRLCYLVVLWWLFNVTLAIFQLKSKVISLWLPNQDLPCTLSLMCLILLLLLLLLLSIIVSLGYSTVDSCLWCLACLIVQCLQKIQWRYALLDWGLLGWCLGGLGLEGCCVEDFWEKLAAKRCSRSISGCVKIGRRCDGLSIVRDQHWLLRLCLCR